jgi:hypothetical protein
MGMTLAEALGARLDNRFWDADPYNYIRTTSETMTRKSGATSKATRSDLAAESTRIPIRSMRLFHIRTTMVSKPFHI